MQGNNSHSSHETESKQPKRRRRRWLRITGRVALVLFAVILLLPVLIYLPPVQSLLKDVACHVIHKSTGMTARVGYFRLKFPVDVKLDSVSLIDQRGDTMLSAGSLVADVKLLPLLHLDVQVNKVNLQDAFYTMTSADSSMVMTLKAGYLKIDGGSNVNIRTGNIKLRRPILKNAAINVGIDVWKQTPDSVKEPTPWTIMADRLDIENVTFGMTMLPTISSLDLHIDKASIADATIDLRNNRIKARSFKSEGGNASYMVPTAAYIASHPAPVDTISPPSPPMTVAIDSISLDGWKATYGTQGVVPTAGFDPQYIVADGISLGITDFFNRSSELRLPLISLKAKERSGLEITSGSGIIAIDSTGINIDRLHITTPHSLLNASADISYALMNLAPDSPVNVKADGSIGLADVYAFMPSLRKTLGMLPQGAPLVFDIDLAGTLENVGVEHCKLSMARFFALNARGNIANPMDIKRMRGSITLDGSLANPTPVNAFLGGTGMKLPPLKIKGNVGVTPDRYNADINLTTTHGSVALDGSLALSAERYDVDFTAKGFNVAAIMPSLGLGVVSGHVTARGAGFNPLHGGFATKVSGRLEALEYGGFNYAPLTLDVTAHNSQYDLKIDIANPNLDLAVVGTASSTGNTFNVDLSSDIRHANLQAMGLMTEACEGGGKIDIQGTANPTDMLFDLTMNLDDVDWIYSTNVISLPHAIQAHFTAEENAVALLVQGQDANIDFSSPIGLSALLSAFSKGSEVLAAQIDKKQFDVPALHENFPEFDLNFDAGGGGLIRQFVDMAGISLESVEGQLSNSDTINGNVRLLGLNTSSVQLDTITLNLSQRAQMLDYKVHIGNTAGNLPEFASINLSGYVGGNRGSVFAVQKNSKGETGYKLGLTAALSDSAVSVHLTPLNAIIAYKNWKISDDNHIDIGFDHRIDADLLATSESSKVELHTGTVDGNSALKIGIADVRVEDFLNMSAFAPPIKGNLNTDMTLVFHPKFITADGDIALNNFSYNRTLLGNIGLDVKAGMGFAGGFGGKINMLLDGDSILTARGGMRADTISSANTRAALTLHRFPLKIANPFLGPDVAQLSGWLNGEMDMTGSFANPLINGVITCDSVGVYVPMIGSTMRFDSNSPITVDNNLLTFNSFKINCANSNPLVLNGNVDARSISNILFDLSLNGNNVAIVNNDRRAHSDIYGKLFVNLDATVRGPMSGFDIDANLTVLPATDISYTIPTASSELSQISSTTDVVKFVQFSDTVTAPVAKESTPSAMQINASLAIVNGAEVTVNLSNNGTDKVQVNPYGNLTFTQNFMGDMRLSGQLSLASGFVRYSPPVISEKKFDFSPDTYVLWNGDIMNPILHIDATDRIKANALQDGQNSRLINFDVGLSVTGTLSAPKIVFDLSTSDDMTIQNELLSMTAEQRSTAAINLMITGSYTGTGVKASSNLGGNPLFSFLESQLNSWAAKNIRGVDLSFGIDQYDKTVNGQSSTTTSYSYQLSKSLLNNRFKIVVGGNYSTDASADENFAENLISDISFEYMLKQTQNLSMYFKLFRHTGYESILEGEITETGLGFVMKRRLSSLRRLFNFGHRKSSSINTDTIPAKQEIHEEVDTTYTD